MKNVKLNVAGMHCTSCEMLIKDALMDEEGVEKADASTKAQSVTVFYDETKTSVEKIKTIIHNEGYEVQ